MDLEHRATPPELHNAPTSPQRQALGTPVRGVSTGSFSSFGRSPRPPPLQEASSENDDAQPSPALPSAQASSATLPSTLPLSLSRRASSLICETTPLVKMRKFFILEPEDSVYSYFQFMPPIDQRRTKRLVTPLIVFAALLVFVNFIMQTGLLVVVGKYILDKHVEWVSTLVHLKNVAWYHVTPMPYNEPPPQCHGRGSSLCYERGDGISCAPKSIEALSNWQSLDINDDGIWSRTESRSDELGEVFQCKYNVDLPLLYDTLVQHLNSSHMMQGRRSTELFSGVSLHKAYYNWFLHKPMLCQYGDADMCGPLFHRGFFDEALLQKSAPMFSDTGSALRYCQQVLMRECFDTLPNTYRVWRFVSNQQCGEKLYGQIMYQSPGIADDDDDASPTSKTPMLTVDFHKHIEYSRTKSFQFRLFLCILLVTFLSVMSQEARSIFKSLVWSITFPKDEEFLRTGNDIVGPRSVEIITSESGDEVREQRIHKVRTDHRIAVLAVTVLRGFLWIFLLWSGVLFLTGRPRYLTLIFDALSLVFIFEIDELLYRTMLRVEFRNDHFRTEPMQVPQFHGGAIKGGNTVIADIIQFGVVIGFAALVVITYCSIELNPLTDALECLCKAEGDHCYDAQQFSKAWWDSYWSNTFPSANMIIDQLAMV